MIFLFALLHDSMRENDGRDPQHGPRAAAFAIELHAEGLLGTTPAQLETLRFACFEHTNGLVTTDPTVGACWDADRLDLPRVWIARTRRSCRPRARTRACPSAASAARLADALRRRRTA